MPVLIRHRCLSRPSLFAHDIDQAKEAVKSGQVPWRSCNKWWISSAEHFCGDLTHEVWRLQLISSRRHADEGSGCHPINYNNWTVVQNCRVPSFSSCIPLSYIFHEIFISSSRELFPAVIDSANLNAGKDFTDSEQDPPYFMRWKLRVDERVEITALDL